MAGNDWERELLNKLMHLAGDDTSWLVDAARALDKAPEFMKKLVLEAMEDDMARRLVDEIIKRAGAASSSGQAGVGAEAGAATVKVVEVLMPEGFDEEPKVYTCELRGQADYMFVTKNGLWFDGDEIIISFDQLVDGRTYSSTPSLAAQVSNMQGFSRRLVDATEDELAEAAVDLLSTSLGDKHVQRVCRKKFRDDEAGVAVEVDAMAAGDTKVLVAEVRMELTEDAVDDAQAKVDKLRKLGATGKHDFKFLANKAIVPAVAGVALTKNEEKLRALQDRIKQDGVPVFMINGARRGVGNECFPRTPATLPPGLARKLSSVAHAPRARTAAAMLAAAWAAVWT